MPHRLAILVLLLAAAAASAGTLTSVDGKTYTGTIKRSDDVYVITDDDGHADTVPVNKVKTIELGGDDPSKPSRERAGLKSLQRSVEFSDDLPRILQRYNTFIAQTKDAAVVALARADLAVWQDRIDRNLVKVGKNWVTPGERDAAVRAARQKAEDARLLIKAGRGKEAARLIADMLEQDPQNVSALYLAGVMAQARKDLGEAKKQFLAVQQILPQHPPTLLNLALINFRQKQWGQANVAMEQALAAAPATQVLLDTAAEYLNALPPDLHKSRPAQQLTKTFLAQDADLQKAMAARHLHRWGSGWVDDAAFDAIKKASDDAQKKIADLQKQFDDTQTKITAADARVSANEQAMRAIESNSYTRTTNGNLVRMPLPPSWYTLQAENAALKLQNEQDQATLQTIRGQANQARSTMPTPTYTGVLTPINEDGVPLTVLPDVPPTTQATPSTVPTTGPAVPPVEPPPATRPDVIRIGPPG